MKTARRSGRSGGKGHGEAARGNTRLKDWVVYSDADVRKAAVQINWVFSLPAEHFEASKLRLELAKWLEGDSWWPPPRPARRLSSRSPSRDREEADVFLTRELGLN
jgi:hypothetical protein